MNPDEIEQLIKWSLEYAEEVRNNAARNSNSTKQEQKPDQPELPTIELKIDSCTISSSRRKLKVDWTVGREELPGGYFYSPYVPLQTCEVPSPEEWNPTPEPEMDLGELPDWLKESD